MERGREVRRGREGEGEREGGREGGREGKRRKKFNSEGSKRKGIGREKGREGKIVNTSESKQEIHYIFPRIID